MRIVDIFLSIPVLFLLIALVTIYHQSEVLLIVVIAFVSWLVPARLIRGETLSLRNREYVQAVRVMGGSRSRIIGRHIIPNSVGTIVVFATFQVADSILLLAALGFLGLGVPAPQTDWGTMLSNGVDAAGNGYWWQIYPAGLCIVLVVVAFNYVGDAPAGLAGGPAAAAVNGADTGKRLPPIRTSVAEPAVVRVTGVWRGKWQAAT